MTTYVCKNQFQVSNSSSTPPLFSTTTSPGIYGNEFSPKMGQQKRSCDREFLSTPDSAISVNDNSTLSPKNDYDPFTQSNETLPSNNPPDNVFYQQHPTSYSYSEYQGNVSAANHLNITDTKEYLQNVIGSSAPDPYGLPQPPVSSNPLVQLESFTREALSNVNPFPKTTIPVSVDYQYTNDKPTSGFIKPPCSYPCLIAIALHNAVTNRLNVSELYEFIQYYFPFFQRAPEGWKNSVRHNLSTNGWFNKVDEGRSGYAGRRSFLWGFTSPDIKEKAINDVKKQVVKKYKDMCESIRCSSLLEPLLNGERSFYPNSCHQSPFMGYNSNGLGNFVKRDVDYHYNGDFTSYHSQPTYTTTSPITMTGSLKGPRKRRTSILGTSESVDDVLLHYNNDSTSHYQPNAKKQFDGNRSYHSFTDNLTNQLVNNDFPNYMFRYNFPFAENDSQRQFNLYRPHLQMYTSPISSDTSGSYNMPKSPTVSSNGGNEFYSNGYTTIGSGNNYSCEGIDNGYKGDEGDSTSSISPTSDGSSSSTVSSSDQGEQTPKEEGKGNNSPWRQPSPSPPQSNPSSTSQKSYAPLERQSTRDESLIDDVLNEFFLQT
uniref:DOMINA protein (inferred by orthology to a D. melanogaster protein) n=1 Tax=Strongyloides venezuelensis TaxID=75913 RepID=A0A0K0G1D3_STRVS